MARIGLICALRMELPQGLPFRLSRGLISYRKNGNALGVMVSGAGYRNAEQATALLCRNFRPDYLLMLGFCGGIDPAIPIGTLVIADRIFYNDEEEHTHAAVNEYIRALLRKAGVQHHIGAYQTFDFPVLSTGHIQKKIKAVDMESFAVARTARQHGIQAAIIKSVSDIVPEKPFPLFPVMRLQLSIAKNIFKARKGLNTLAKHWF
ncbi:MAG: hypothetical protein KatS3mg031_0515 [Chitinophagales bacterium]|nr:MAG: hypothetical protein KatS3mg031_0515 [Chitinophagales bacterium]